MKSKKIYIVLFFLVLFSIYGGEAMALTISSSAFKEGNFIPEKYTCKGRDISVPLTLKSIPKDVKSFALICDDPDAPFGTWVHWVIYDIPADVTEIKEGVPTDKVLPDGSKQGINDFGKIGYGGPCPPPGNAHRYVFKIYALDVVLNIEPGLTKALLLKKMEGHIIEESKTTGKFKR